MIVELPADSAVWIFKKMDQYVKNSTWNLLYIYGENFRMRSGWRGNTIIVI